MYYVYLHMNKKTKLMSFRTTKETLNYLKLIAETDNRSASYVLNKMIETFRNRGCYTLEQIN